MYKRNKQGWVKHYDFILLDLIAQQLAFILSYCIYNGNFTLPYLSENYRTIAVILILLDLVYATMMENFHNVLQRGLYVEFTQTLKLTLLDFASMSVVMFFLKLSGSYSRVILTMTFVFHTVLSWSFRVIRKRRVIEMNVPVRTMILVVDEKNLRKVLSRNKGAEEVKVVGLVLLNRDAEGETICDIPVVANMDNAAMYVCREWVDEVFVYPNSLSQIERKGAPPKNSSIIEDDFLDWLDKDDVKIYEPKSERDEEEQKEALSEFIQQCHEMAVPVHIRLGINGLSGKNFVEKVYGFNVLTTTANFASPFQLFLKRCIDIIGGLVGSLIALIIMAIVGPKIKKESPGPILFKQERIGQNGKHFKVYKIRSMYMDAEERKKEFLKQNRVADGMMFKMEFDPRVIGNYVDENGVQHTGIGERLRSHSLDEFPQFFNTLRGDMSIVGTRPPTLDEWEKYQYHHRARLSFKPGITGMWQANGRSNITDFEEVVRLDTEYIEHWSIGLDIRLILKTVKNIIHGDDGAM